MQAGRVVPWKWWDWTRHLTAAYLVATWEAQDEEETDRALYWHEKYVRRVVAAEERLGVKLT